MIRKSGGQFAPAGGGQFAPARGGQFDRHLQSGTQSNVRSVKRRIYSILGPQESDHIFLKVPTRPLATKW